MYVAKQARNEETRRRNMRVRNCQRSRFGFVARQLCGHHRNIYGQIEIWPPLAILARSPRDKFINLATLGGPSALLASRGKRSVEVFRGGYDSFTCLLIVMDLRSIFTYYSVNWVIGIASLGRSDLLRRRVPCCSTKVRPLKEHPIVWRNVVHPRG